MKKIFMFLAIVSALVLVGCSSDDNFEPLPTPTPSPTPKPDYEDNLRDSVGTATRPTAWIATSDALLDKTEIDRVVVTSSEIPVPVDLTSDMMAAFVNGECRAVATPISVNGKAVFDMNVMHKMEGETADIAIELRYFSLHNKRIYIAKSFAFASGYEIHGSITHGGYKAEWR